jgi:hypothetical protein
MSPIALLGGSDGLIDNGISTRSLPTVADQTDAIADLDAMRQLKQRVAFMQTSTPPPHHLFRHTFS